MAALGNCVGRRRAAAGLRQHDLAARVGVSRQSLSTLEAGHSVPSAALALRLAHELGCRVEDSFFLIDERHAPIRVELAGDETAPRDQHRPSRTRRVAPAEARVVLASIDGRWVAHRLAASDPGALATAADGAITGRAARVTPFADIERARDTLLCAGCAPAGGILAARTSAARTGDRVVWLDRSSGAALDLLARGQVHVAGAHLYDEDANEFNVPFVQRRLPGRLMLVFNLARWQAGLVVAPGIRGASAACATLRATTSASSRGRAAPPRGSRWSASRGAKVCAHRQRRWSAAATWRSRRWWRWGSPTPASRCPRRRALTA